MNTEYQNEFPANKYFLELGSVPESISFSEIWQTLFANKFLILAIVIILEGFIFYFAKSLPTMYRAEVLATEASHLSSTDATVENASLLNVEISSNEITAMLTSREFLGRYITENNLLPIIFQKEWDSAKKQWKVEKEEDIPTLWDGYKRFNEKILDVTKDAKTNLTILQIDWVDPLQAAEWANGLINKLNELMRQRAIQEAQTTIQYLTEELQTTVSIDLKLSLNELILIQKAKIVAANVHKQFAFRIIDPAVVPKKPSASLTPILLAAGLVLGIFLGVTFALAREFVRKQKHQSDI
jgi:uncharacterized protein involved in exopolysaccharide biosynthesis